jgi:hypothetical protein
MHSDRKSEFDDQFDAMRFARSLADERELPARTLGRVDGCRDAGIDELKR